jgi:hypothetical protein
VGAEHPSNLDGGRARPSRGTQDEQVLSGPERGQLDQAVARSQVVDWDGGRLDKGDVIGNL